MIEPIKDASPIAHVYEREGRVERYVEEHNLLDRVGAVWHYTSVWHRVAMLKHLLGLVRADEPPYRRFHTLRNELETYGSEEDFIEIVAWSRALGEDVPLVLHMYIALYIDSTEGREYAQFSDQAFYA
ncbi:MAG TPA: hypothetical protein VIY48_17215, partial [Candidatus Paceibacterota bacterium]